MLDLQTNFGMGNKEAFCNAKYCMLNNEAAIRSFITLINYAIIAVDEKMNEMCVRSTGEMILTERLNDA